MVHRGRRFVIRGHQSAQRHTPEQQPSGGWVAVAAAAQARVGIPAAVASTEQRCSQNTNRAGAPFPVKQTVPLGRPQQIWPARRPCCPITPGPHPACTALPRHRTQVLTFGILSDDFQLEIWQSFTLLLSDDRTSQTRLGLRLLLRWHPGIACSCLSGLTRRTPHLAERLVVLPVLKQMMRRAEMVCWLKRAGAAGRLHGRRSTCSRCLVQCQRPVCRHPQLEHPRPWSLRR